MSELTRYTWPDWPADVSVLDGAVLIQKVEVAMSGRSAVLVVSYKLVSARTQAGVDKVWQLLDDVTRLLGAYQKMARPSKFVWMFELSQEGKKGEQELMAKCLRVLNHCGTLVTEDFRPQVAKENLSVPFTEWLLDWFRPPALRTA